MEQIAQVKVRQRMPTSDTEVMQPAGNLHHQIGAAFLGQAQNIFANATACDAGDQMLDLDPACSLLTIMSSDLA